MRLRYAFLFQISISTFFLFYLQLPIMLVKKSIFIGTICALKVRLAFNHITKYSIYKSQETSFSLLRVV